MFRIQDSWKNGSFSQVQLDLGKTIGPFAQFGPLILMCLVDDTSLSIVNLESRASFSIHLDKPSEIQATIIEIDKDNSTILDNVLLGYSDGSAQVISILDRRIVFDIPSSFTIPIKHCCLKGDSAVFLSEDFTLFVYALEKDGGYVLLHRMRSTICSLPALLTLDDQEVTIIKK